MVSNHISSFISNMLWLSLRLAASSQITQQHISSIEMLNANGQHEYKLLISTLQLSEQQLDIVPK